MRIFAEKTVLLKLQQKIGARGEDSDAFSRIILLVYRRICPQTRYTAISSSYNGFFVKYRICVSQNTTLLPDSAAVFRSSPKNLLLYGSGITM